VTSLRIAGIIAFITGGLVSTYFESQARRRLSLKGDSHPWTVYVLGIWAGSDQFTVEGWKFHKRAILIGGLTALIAFPLIFWH
jgi:hypothetical protein